MVSWLFSFYLRGLTFSRVSSLFHFSPFCSLPLFSSDIPSPSHSVLTSSSSSMKRSVEIAGLRDDHHHHHHPREKEDATGALTTSASPLGWNMERRLSLQGVTKLDFLASLCLRPATTMPDNRRSKRLKRMEENKSRAVPFPAAGKETKVRLGFDEGCP